VLELTMRTVRETHHHPVMVAGIVGKTGQATTEAEIAVALGYDVGLLSLGAWREELEDEILRHCERIAEIIPLFGFYLQPAVGGQTVVRWIDGGLLGQWAMWTHSAVDLLRRAKSLRSDPAQAVDLLRIGAALTDANAAIFDAAHGFSGCIPGIHEVLRRQGLLVGTWCLDPNETLSPRQDDEITRVTRSHPQLTD